MASIDAASTIRAALEALRIATDGLTVEIIVADASTDRTARIVREWSPAITVIECPPRTLVPQLWAAGLSCCHAAHVGFTTAEFCVSPTWARSALAALTSGADVAGGPLEPSPALSAVGRATYYLRYAGFLDGRLPAGPVVTVDRLPGENAVYARGRIVESRAPLALGFWETDVNHAIRRAGGRLVTVADARATFQPSASLASIARARFAHGRHSGAGRVTRGERRRWQVVAAAPLVPLVLTVRAARRVLRIREHRLRFLGALPSLLVLSAAWSAGEVWGAVRGAGLAPVSQLARAS